jgi:sulfur relay (sulfurtransferase) DsrC/TusE family protein
MEMNQMVEAFREVVSTIDERLQESGEDENQKYATNILKNLPDDFATEVYEAFKSNTNAKLFVYVLNMKEVNISRRTALLSFLKDQKNLEHPENVNYVIHYFTKIENSPTVILVPLNYKKFGDLMLSLDKIKKLVKEFNASEEQEAEKAAEDLGEDLYRHLTEKKELLQHSECNSSYGVWINCKDEVIDPLWEWLYKKSEDFFWGDKFSIVRLSKGTEQLNVHNLEISNFAYLKGKVHSKHFDQVSGICEKIKPKFIELDELGDSSLGSFKGIHVFTGGSENYNIGAYRKSIDSALLKMHEPNTPYFLFLNMCGCKELRLQITTQPDNHRLFLPETWIDTYLDVEETFAVAFEIEFYKELCYNRTNVAEALINARRKLSNNVCRLAYFLNGNPCVNISLQSSNQP